MDEQRGSSKNFKNNFNDAFASWTTFDFLNFDFMMIHLHLHKNKKSNLHHKKNQQKMLQIAGIFGFKEHYDHLLFCIFLRFYEHADHK